MLAAFEGHEEILRIIVNANKERAMDSDIVGNTTLHYAAWGGHLPIVMFLIEVMGHDAFVKNNEGLTPMQLAAAGNCHAIVSYLLETPDGVDLAKETSSGGLNTLHRAVVYGALDVVKLLTSSSKEKAASLDATTANESTVLHLASQHNRLEVLKHLLEVGQCDTNAQNEYGLTPLHLSCIG
jgi:receptor-interacting serine/threonine-protein kinase 4